MRPRIFIRHLYITRDRGRAESDFCVGKLETATRACQRHVEGFPIERVDDRSAAAVHDTWYVNLCRSAFLVRFEMNRQVQCRAKCRAGGREDGEKIAQRDARFTRDNRFESAPLSFIRARIDHDLARAVSLRDLAGPLVEARPLQARQRRIVEMAVNDFADEGRLTIAVGARQVELATAIDGAIAVVIGLAFENPLICHSRDLSSSCHDRFFLVLSGSIVWGINDVPLENEHRLFRPE